MTEIVEVKVPCHVLSEFKNDVVVDLEVNEKECKPYQMLSGNQFNKEENKEGLFRVIYHFIKEYMLINHIY